MAEHGVEEPREELRVASAGRYVIRNVAGGPKRLLVVGHNPGLQELALGLTCKGDAAERKALGGNMPTSGLVVLDFELSDWADAAFGGGKLSHFVSPKILREGS